MEQILVVEDDRELNAGLCRALKGEGRTAVSCGSVKEAEEQINCMSASLVLLDVNLPDGSGLELLQRIKARAPALPVILLTANDTDRDIVEGLERGADDYITKPFSLAVLRARVNTQLRRRADTERGSRYESGRFSFDFDRMSFLAYKRAIELSKTEQKLLRLLIGNRGNPVGRGTLIDKIWTDGAEYVDENALSVTVNRLRGKLGAPECIKTVYGVGYMWVDRDE